MVAFTVLTTSATASVSWDEVKKKIQSSRSYEVQFSYLGKQGEYVIDYRFAGSKIRTEILSSKTNRHHVGTVIVFDESWDPDKVRVWTGGGLVTLNLTHEDVLERPHFHQSLFHIVLEKVGTRTPKTRAIGQDTVFIFGPALKIRVNEAADIVEMEIKQGRFESLKRFSGHLWNGAPDTDF
jgi:hypothetical protein